MVGVTKKSRSVQGPGPPEPTGDRGYRLALPGATGEGRVGGLGRRGGGGAPWGIKGAQERAVSVVRHHPRGQAPGEVSATGCHHLQRQIAGLGAPDVDHDTQRLGGERIVVCILQRGIDNWRSAVAGRVQNRPQCGTFRGSGAPTHIIRHVAPAGRRARGHGGRRAGGPRGGASSAWGGTRS